METNKNIGDVSNLSEARISRIKEQGYALGYSKDEICQHAVGNRFAYQMCTLLFTTGLILTNIPILAVAMLIAALTVFLPYHPFDYLYNHSLRHWLNRPKLPPRSAQAKFACGIASICLGVIIYLFYQSLYLWGYLLGGVLFVVAILVSTVDYCIPSKIYNALFQNDKAV
ncbi:DUF4395 domain-containing protein [Fodinibius saliphilus]|uniref:DUF4395 domain-containing protein n=1 Tax=Fodinibius saliphilus TaxID=1920650 RepID=UPI001107F6C7|nr:DUF4395 domain-containing protein [Fodinibius saliphilus]